MASISSRPQWVNVNFVDHCPSVRPSVRHTFFSQCSCHFIMKFSGVIAIDKGDVHANAQDQRSRTKVTEVKTNFASIFASVLIHWWLHIARTVPLLRRDSDHPRAHTVNLGRMTTRTPAPGHAAKPGVIALIRPLRPHCSRTLWCYPLIPRTPNLLKISLDIESDFRNGFVSTLHTDFKGGWNLCEHYWPVTRKYIWCYPQVQPWMTASHSGRKLCNGAFKCGQGSHVGMFSLWNDAQSLQ